MYMKQQMRFILVKLYKIFDIYIYIYIVIYKHL